MTFPSLFDLTIHRMLIYFHIYTKLFLLLALFPGAKFVVPDVNIVGSDSTPPPVTKMSPVSNKFEGIPQQQR